MEYARPYYNLAMLVITLGPVVQKVLNLNLGLIIKALTMYCALNLTENEDLVENSTKI